MIRQQIPHNRYGQADRLFIARVDGCMPLGTNICDISGQDQPVSAAFYGCVLAGCWEGNDGFAAGEVDPSRGED